MTRLETFTFRVNKNERRIIADLAKRLQRNQSDTVRLIIREAAHSLTLGSDLDEKNDQVEEKRQ